MISFNKLLKLQNLDLKNNKLKRSMLLNTLSKPVSMVIAFLYTPLLLNYLGEESYGIWVTILSIINWINFFDIGIGNGLRNLLVKEIEGEDTKSIRQSVSTAYVAISMISIVVFILGSIIIISLNLYKMFNTDVNVKPALFISFVFICINFILSLCKNQLYVMHQAEKVGFMTVLIQFINLVGIICISVGNSGNLVAVAIVIGGSGLLVNLMFSRHVWKKNNNLIPKIKYFTKDKLSIICNVGIKFFFIQIAAMILYTTDNLIITYLFGPSKVTPYYTAYTAFGIINGLFAAMLAPLWSKYTVAMVRNDYKWIKKSILSLNKMLVPIAMLLMVGILYFKPISVIWLHKELDYDNGLILCMGIYFFMIIWGSIYANVMNGIGQLNLQLVMAVLSAIINIPLSYFLGKTMHLQTTGVLLATIICMLITNIIVAIRVHRHINSKINN
jgi:O-antigen/teichoic acid export membrane protein